MSTDEQHTERGCIDTQAPHNYALSKSVCMLLTLCIDQNTPNTVSETLCRVFLCPKPPRDGPLFRPYSLIQFKAQTLINDWCWQRVFIGVLREAQPDKPLLSMVIHRLKRKKPSDIGGANHTRFPGTGMLFPNNATGCLIVLKQLNHGVSFTKAFSRERT